MMLPADMHTVLIEGRSVLTEGGGIFGLNKHAEDDSNPRAEPPGTARNMS